VGDELIHILEKNFRAANASAAGSLLPMPFAAERYEHHNRRPVLRRTSRKKRHLQLFRAGADHAPRDGPCGSRAAGLRLKIAAGAPGDPGRIDAPPTKRAALSGKPDPL